MNVYIRERGFYSDEKYVTILELVTEYNRPYTLFCTLEIRKVLLCSSFYLFLRFSKYHIYFIFILSLSIPYSSYIISQNKKIGPLL